MANFRLVDRETSFLLPPSVDEWLPEGHLARFVVEITDQLDIWLSSGPTPAAARTPTTRGCWGPCFFTATPGARLPPAKSRKRALSRCPPGMWRATSILITIRSAPS